MTAARSTRHAAHYSGMPPSASTIARQPAGTPAGGRFAAHAGTAPDVELDRLDPGVADLIDAARADHQRAVAWAKAANRSRILIATDARLRNGVGRCVDCGRFAAGPGSDHDCPYPKLASTLGNSPYARRLAHAGFDASSAAVYQAPLRQIGIAQSAAACQLGVGPMHAIALHRQGIDFVAALEQLVAAADQVDDELTDDDRAELAAARLASRRASRNAASDLAQLVAEAERLVNLHARRTSARTGLDVTELAAYAMSKIAERIARTDLPPLESDRLSGYVAKVLSNAAINLGRSRSMQTRTELSAGVGGVSRTVSLDAIGVELVDQSIVASATTERDDALDAMVGQLEGLGRSGTHDHAARVMPMLTEMFGLPTAVRPTSKGDRAQHAARSVVESAGGIRSVLALIRDGDANDQQLNAVLLPWGGLDLDEPSTRSVIKALRAEPSIWSLAMTSITPRRVRPAVAA